MFTWNEENIEKLKALVNKGLPVTKIAESLGISRGSAMGKISRMKLQLLGKISNPKVRKQKENKMMITGNATISATIPTPHFSIAEAVINLKYDDCRWPLGDTSDINFAFCGNKSVENKSYCEYHCAMAYIAPVKRFK